MPDRPFLSRFTPSRNDPDILETIFVQRHELAKDTVERIHESAVSGNKHHLLFIGPRGSGKTHFVSLICNRITRCEDLDERLRIAWLGEDETTTSFLDLLLRIYRALQQRYTKEFPAAALQALYDLPPATAAQSLGKLLLENLAGRSLLVIVENMDVLFSGLKEAGQKQWRAFIQENAVFTTLATSQQLFEGVSRRDKAFFGFFQIEYLKPLSVEEAVLLLKKIAELSEDTNLAAFLQTPAGRARVRALHHLSGGNHRIYIVLSQFITRETLDELIGPFEKMIDELTPYYQARVNWLSPQQRKLVEFLCTCQQPVPVTEIARPLFMTHQTATGQLKELREKGYVQSHARGRESLYELTEPLMRMCIEVKENRREPIRLVVDFLRIWCTPGQLQKLPARSSVEKQYVQSAMLAINRGEEDLRVRWILHDLEHQQQMGQPEEQIRTLEELTETRGHAHDWVELGDALRKERRHAEALTAYDKALELDPKFPRAWNFRGFALENLGRYAEALVAYDQALNLDPKDAYAWKNRGNALWELGRHEEALAAYDKALELDPKSFRAWNFRGFALSKLGRSEEALVAYDQAFNLDPKDAYARKGRGIALEKLGRYAEALVAYDQALNLDPKDAYAWYNRGNALWELGRPTDALAAYDKSLELDPEDATAMYNRGVVLENLGRFEEALAAYDKAHELDPKSPCAWNYRNFLLLSKLGRYEEALAVIDQACELYPKDPGAWLLRGVVLFNLGRFEGALVAYDQALELDQESPNAWKFRGFALKSLNRYEEALIAYDKALNLDPKDTDAWNGRGIALTDLGRYAEALTAYDQVREIDPTDPFAALNRVEALLLLDQWEPGFASLQQSLEEFPPSLKGYAGNTEALVKIMMTGSLEKATWQQRTSRLVAIYAEAQALTYLGECLVRSLATLSVNMLSAEALTAWSDVWHEAGADHDQLIIPLRIFDAGIRYLQTKDRRALLDLLTEERKILAEALGIDMGTE